MTLDVGSLVECETLEGETMTGIVVRDLETTAADHEIEVDGEPVSIWRFWGRTIPEDDPVVRVWPVTRDEAGEWVSAPQRAYDYPVSRISELDSTLKTDAGEGESPPDHFEYDADRDVFRFECDRCGATAEADSRADLAKWALRGGCPECTTCGDSHE